MATVMIYYSREDGDYDDYNLYLIPGINNSTGLLFPDIDVSSYYSDYPRQKKSFSVSGSLGYVSIDTNTAQKFAFYIKRKDGYMDYSGNLCTCNSGTPNYECYHCKVAGDVYNVDTRFVSTCYVKPNDQYLYINSDYENIHPQNINTLNDGSEFGLTHTVEIYQDYNNKQNVIIPEEDNTSSEWIEYGVAGYDDLVLLYLEGKTYNIGENMDLSIDSDALNAEKADALQIVEKQIANALFQIGEVPADFDEAAFVADVDAYKATKDASLANTIDYLKKRIDARANLI